MSRVTDMISSLEHHELLKIKKDLLDGGIHLKKLIDDNILEKEKTHQKACSVCMTELNPKSVENYTLIFGRHDFRKKASFCGLDCLTYFLDNLNKQKNIEVKNVKTD